MFTATVDWLSEIAMEYVVVLWSRQLRVNMTQVVLHDAHIRFTSRAPADTKIPNDSLHIRL